MHCHWDVFGAILDDPSSTGILDDVRDLRCYLFLVEEYATRLLEEREANKTNAE